VSIPQFSVIPNSVTSPQTFGPDMDQFLAESNPIIEQMNLEIDGVNAASATSAAAAFVAETAIAAANYKGNWATASGAATAGWTYGHNGVIWLLETSVANIALEVPGTSALFTPLTGVQMVTRTSNVIITNADLSEIIRVTTGGFTQTFQAVASLLNGFFCWYWNDSATVVTLDPNGSETINGATTLALSPGEYAFIWVSGGALFALVSSRSVGDHCIELHSGNGYGSTNTRIRRWLTVLKNVGIGVTYADSGTLGSSFTAVQPGLYSCEYADRSTSTFCIGLSLNTTQPTVSINTQGGSPFPIAERLVMTQASANELAFCSCTVRLAVGDVVRTHTDGNANETTNWAFFRIRRIGN
jgi:hypothetical protein